MDKQRKKELQAQYKEMKQHMGVVQITNTQNGKIYIASYPDLRNQWQTIQMWLDSGVFGSGALVRDWREFGKEAFRYEVLEEKEKDGESPQQVQQILHKMEKEWLELLQPYDEKGYNRKSL